MANKDHGRIIKQGVGTWNAWRQQNPVIRPDLTGANLSGADLSGANLSKVDLNEASLVDANLKKAILMEANLFWADLSSADLTEADLRIAGLGDANCWRTRLTAADLSAADLRGARFTEADLSRANLSGADLSGADLSAADLRGAKLDEANLNEARVGWTIFGDTDLSTTKGLKTVTHGGPSTIGVDTLFRSHDHIPEVFLLGAGVPEEFITQIPALIASVKPIQFQSCFISYSHRDEEFAKRLHSAMRSESLRVWFAPEEMKGGKKLHDQIFQAIQLHDRLLLVLSTYSMKSDWVITEIKRAKKVEREENRRKLFPIRLVDFETIQKWECFDADSGKDLAVDLREFYIPDFSTWKDHDAFEKEFAKLLRDLREEEISRAKD